MIRIEKSPFGCYLSERNFGGMKATRHKTIVDIINSKDIDTQEGLLEALRSQGFDVTQATVSRDIKTLDLVKVLDENGKYRYTQRIEYAAKRNSTKFKAVFLEAVIGVDYAMNTAVIKCHIGMGNAACAALDSMEHENVVGTIAGDDTIFVLLRTERAAQLFVEKIDQILHQ